MGQACRSPERLEGGANVICCCAASAGAGKHLIPINQNESKSPEAFGVRVFRDNSYLDGLAPALL